MAGGCLAAPLCAAAFASLLLERRSFSSTATFIPRHPIALQNCDRSKLDALPFAGGARSFYYLRYFKKVKSMRLSRKRCFSYILLISKFCHLFFVCIMVSSSINDDTNNNVWSNSVYYVLHIYVPVSLLGIQGITHSITKHHTAYMYYR